MINYQNKLPSNTVNQEKIIYDHLRSYVRTHTAEAVTLEFRCIFLEGRSQNTLVRNALENIILSNSKKEKFPYILNYCYYLIIGYWLEQEISDRYIIQLITLLANTNYNAKACSRLKNKVLSLIKEFIDSEYYQKLKRIALIFNYEPLVEYGADIPVSYLLTRYTYLYKPLITSKDNFKEFTNSIEKLQIKRTKSFELKLAQHIIYRIRLVEIAKAQQFSSGAGKIIRQMPNPTLLSNRDIKIVFKQYIKKVDNNNTLYQLSRKFIADNHPGISYRIFKRNLYFYLISNLEARKDNCDFPEKLWTLLDNIYYQSDNLPINHNLILRTCRKLYQYLIISNSQKNQHTVLIKLISNFGTAQTVMLLIKIVLICPQAKIDLEQRLAKLYSCYEDKSIEYVPWMIKFLEHFFIAFSIYFGKIDISLAKSL